MQNVNTINCGDRRILVKSSYKQQGALLPLALIVLLVVTLLGVSAVTTTNIDLQIAGSQQRQFEAEMVAENAVNFLVDNYPSPTMPTSTNFETFGLTMTQNGLAEACITKTIVSGSGTPGSLACSWTGNGSAHESFSGSRNCKVGDYVSTWHPHLHHMTGNKELWINGNVTVEMCGDCFTQVGIINYTGEIINSCTKKGYSWPANVTRNKVTQAAFNTAAGAGPSVGGDYYSHVEIRVTTTDPISGATATAVKGLKYRGDGTTSTTVGSPSDATCGIDDANPITEVAEDSDLATNGQKKVLYSYLEID